MRKKGMVWALVAGLVPGGALGAEGDGGLAGNFLTLGIGARAMGMGFAHVAASEDSSAALWNPANLARMTRSEATAGDFLFPEGANYLFLGGAYPLLGQGTFAAALARLSEGIGERRTAANVAEGTFTSNHLGVVLSYGRRVGPASLGASVVMVQHGLDTDTQTGITASLGGLVDARELSAALAGLSAGIRLGHLVPAKFGTSAVPPSVRPGAEYRLLGDALVLAVDADATVGKRLRVSAGAEYTYKRMVSVRAGWNGYLTAGVGGRVGPLRADYAVGAMELGMAHRASLTMSFGTDLSVPRITVREPAFDAGGVAVVSSAQVKIDILIESADPLKAVRIAGRAMKLTETHRFALKQPAGLKEGKNPFRIEVETVTGGRAAQPLVIVADTKPPAIQILEPAQGMRTKADQVNLRAVVSDVSEIMAVSVNELPVFIQPADKIEVNQAVSLPYGGRNVIRIAATDRMGHTGLSQVEVGREGGPAAPAGGADSKVAVDEQTARQSVEKGKEYMRIGRHDVAVVELRYALKLMPGLSEARTLLAEAEREVVKAPAQQQLSPAGGGEGDSSEMTEVKKAMDSHFARGKQLYDLGQYKRAEEEFKLVLELNKQYTAAADLLKKCQERLREYVNTRLKEANAARQKGQLAKQISLLRDVLSQDDQSQMALEMQRTALSQIPSEVRRLHLKALELYAGGKVEEALGVWREARELSPDDEQIRKAIERAESRLIELKSGQLGR